MIRLNNILNEEWSDKYKRSIDCNNPKGFSQKAHCQGKEKSESVNEAKTYKKGDKLKIKLPNGKKFDVVFDTYTKQKGVALGKFKDGSGEYDIKPFNLDTIVESVNESAKSDKLAVLMNKVIEKVDSSLSYKDFAMAVGKILKDEYGSHLYSAFVQELNKELKKENENLSKLTTYLPTENKSIEEGLTISIRNLINDLVPRDIQNAITPQQQERRQSFIRDLVKTLNQFYKQNRVDWRFADSNIKFKMYSKD